MSTFPSVADTGKPTSSSLRACENTMLRPLKSAPAREKSAATTGSTSLIRRPKRQVTRIACQSCRERKSKCDGERPTCGACRAKDLICTYKVGRGVSRATDMKLRNARLQKDLGSMLELYWYIQSTSPSKANEIIDKIRAGAEPVTVFGMLSGHSESTLTVDRGSTSSSTADPEAAQARDGLSTASTVDVELLGSELAQSGALAGLDGSECQDLLELEREDEDEDVSLGQEDDLAVNFLQTPEATKVLRSAVQTFLICTGSLFHVFSAEEVDELFVTAFGTNQEQRDLLALISTQDDNSLRKAVMCSLFAMAAIGLQYTREPVRAIRVDDTAEADSKGIHTDSFYQLSRYLLDDAIRTNIPLAIKSLTVLTMYNIITHSTVALAYANMGLSLARNQGYAANQLSIVARQHVWEDCKRVIRTLISLKSWLVATLGYVPNSMDHDYHNYILQDIEVAPEDLIHRELAKVTIIKASIIRMKDSYMQLQPSNLQKIRTDLTRWHEELPEWMRLSSLIRECDLPPTMKRVVLFVHLFYLSAINLVSRIVHGSELKLGRALTHDDIRIAVSEGLIASRVSAGILGLMLAEDSLFKKCWLCIFQSYMSCLTILYGATRKIASGYTRSDWQQELSAAETCISVLEFCASTDHIAREFVQTTRIFYDRVDSIDKEQSTLWTESTAPGYATQGNTQETAESTDYLFSGPCETRPDVEELSNQLRLIIGQPFTGSLSQQSCDLFPIIEQMDTLTSIEEISIGAHLEWSLQAKCLCTSPSSKGKAKETSQREALLKSLAGVGAGRFIDSARPSGWSVWT